MKRHVALVGAFDRFNYGDLLFPQITRWALRQLGIEADFRCYSTREADLSPLGGVATASLRRLAQDATEDTIVVLAGGDILAARWTDAYRHLGSPARSLALKVLEKTLGGELPDRLARRALGTELALPWVFAPGELGAARRIAYSGVSGSGLPAVKGAHRRRLAERLARAADLSVRDAESQEVLRGWGLAPRLVPDPASLMARRWSREELLRLASSAVERILERFPEGYLVLQAGRFPVAGKSGEIARQLARLTEATGLGVVLLPLGRAAGHEDTAALERIGHLLAAENEQQAPELIEGEATVFDLMAILAHARLFAGTSLHGNLTAMAFEVPRVGLGRVAKLGAFLRAWDTTQPEGCSPFEKLAERALTALAGPPEVRAEDRQRLEEESWEHFRQLARVVDGGA